MRCLVTGVAGFVGSHLAERLLTDGHEVYGIDAFIDYYPRPIKEKNLEGPRSWHNFTCIEGNLLDLPLAFLLEGVNVVFHQAAQAGVRASWGDEFARYGDCNIIATQKLLEVAVRSKDLQRFVYASSSSIYGETKSFPVSEDTIPMPVSPYGVTKLAAEHLCTLYHQNFNVPTVSLRYFTVYGPRQRPDMAFNRFCKAVIAHKPIHVFGDGQQTRDFTYISDIVEANMRAAALDSAIGQVMNVAGGSRVTVQHVIQLLSEISGEQVDVVFDQKQHGDVRDTFADTARAQRIIGYHPCVDLQTGLANEFEYMLSMQRYESDFVCGQTMGVV